MFPIIQLGPIALPVPGLILIAGLWVGLSLSESRAKKIGENPGHLYNLVFLVLIFGIIGARLTYAATYPDAFIKNPLSLISLNPGLLDPLAGVLIGITAAIIYTITKKLSIWSTLDSLTPLFAVMGIAIGISNLASGKAFGAPTDQPWGITLWGATRHPTQIYDLFLATLIFAVILILDRTDWAAVPGNLFISFLALSAGSRLFIEGFRGDSVSIAGSFRTAQVISWFVLAVCLFLLGQRIKNKVTGVGKNNEK
ncbi:MAG: prolipoprotein diacylglyceryl transferase [Chloroflexota bacterium]|nr:MAG: prolipoprotein diacylglyceryl transferase [Chloroflexota bacterium]